MMPSRFSWPMPAARGDVRERLKAAPDLARSLARLVVGRGGPRDLAAVRDGITAAAGLAARWNSSRRLPSELAQATQSLRRPDPAIAAELATALADELPYLKRTAASCARAMTPCSTRRARCATNRAA